MSIATSLTSQGYMSLSGPTLRATSVNVQSGTMIGYGTVEGSITTNAYLAPSGGAPYRLQVTGNYTQTANGELSEQWGSTLFVNGNATLSGYVGVNPKRPPKQGSTYTAMTFGSLSGEFTSGGSRTEAR